MDYNEEMLIEELGIFTKAQIDSLKELGISTLGDLLGATAGMQRLPFPIEENNWLNIRDKVVELAGKERIEEYQKPLMMPPLGLRGNKNE